MTSDAISREMALDGVDAMYNNSWDIKDFCENVKLMLNKLPSVQPLSVLDDIKAEILGLMSHDDYMVDGMNIIEIIDKHTQ